MKMVLAKKSILWLFVVVFVVGTAGFNYGFLEPNSNIEAAKFENRKITEFPSVSIQQKGFYTEFEKWYRDRMYRRGKLIFGWRKLCHKIGLRVNFDKNLIVTDVDDWILERSMPKAYVDDGNKLRNLIQLRDFCVNKNIPFLLMLAPHRSGACRRYYPPVYREEAVDYLQISSKAVELLMQHNIGYVDTCPAIMKAMENDNPNCSLYIKDDHHWSCYGAMLASDILLKQLEKVLGVELYDGELTDGSVVEGDRECSYWRRLGLGDDKAWSRQDVPWHKKFTKNLELEDCYSGKITKPNKPIVNKPLWGCIVNGEGIIHNRDVHNGKTLLMLHDSYGSYMMPYLSQYFETVVDTHYRDKAGKKKNTNMKYLLERYKPDVVVLFPISYPQSDAKSIFKNIVYE